MATYLLTTEPTSCCKAMLMKKATIYVLVFFCCLAKLNGQTDSVQNAMLLPLQTTAFEAAVINQNIQLKWTVSSNEEARSFEIERADNGADYKKIGSRLSAAKTGFFSYEFVDALPKKNTAFAYRVKILAKDGTSLYSNVQNTRIEEGALHCKLKQNPVRHVIEVEVQAANAGSATATVFTAYGQMASTEAVRLSAGANLLRFPSQNLLPGLHRFVLETGSERKVISFVKE